MSINHLDMTPAERVKEDYTPKNGLTGRGGQCAALFCPYCGEEQGDLWESPELFSIIGTQDERTEYQCDSCEETFYVQERISRSFTSFKSEA